MVDTTTQELLQQNRKAVAEGDTLSARESNIALTEAFGDVETAAGVETLSFDQPVSTLKFNAPVPHVRKALSENTKKNEAAFGALLSGESDIAAEFNRIKEELDKQDASPRLDSIKDFLNTDDDTSRRNIIEQTLVDPNVSVENKSKLLDGYLIERDRQENLSNIYAKRLAILESQGENLEASESRLNQSELLDQVVEAKRQEQMILNRFLAESDDDTLNALVDFVEAVIPFSQVKAVSEIQAEFEKEVKGDLSLSKDLVNRFATKLSEQKESIKDLLSRVPVEERAALTEKLAEITTRHAGITGMNKNDFEKHFLLREFLESGYYGEAEKWIDNIVALLDLVGLGRPARSGTGAAEQFFRASQQFNTVKPGSNLVVRENVEGESRMESVVDLDPDDFEVVSGKMHPASPMSTTKDSNPGTTREIYDAAMEDQTGELSKASSGVDKVESSTQLNSAKPRSSNKPADSIPGDMEKNQRIRDEETADIVGFAYKPTGIHYQRNEIREAAVKAFKQMQEVNGLSPRLAMSGYDNSRGFVDINMVYGANADSGFSTAKEAIDVAEFNLRPLGVTKEDLSVLVKDPITNKYLPFDNVQLFGDKPIKGDFAVQLNYKYRYNPKDTDMFGSNAVSWKWADRLSGGRVMLSKYIADTSTRFDRYIAQGAFRAIDKAFALEKKLIDVFKNDFNKLSGKEKVKVMDIAKESNEQRFKYDVASAMVKGLSRKEAEALQKWYKYWDTIWEIDNRDLVRTLKGDGFQLFTNDKAGTKLFVKPLKKQSDARKVKLVYDPLDDSVRKLSPEEIKVIYDEGGTIAKTKQIIQEVIGQRGKKPQIEAINHIVARQDSGNVMRGLRDDDTALSYIPGYYKVAYKDKYFITETFTDAAGTKHSTVIGASATSGGARVTSKRLGDQSDENYEYSVRRGRETKDLSLFDQKEWEINVSQGRSSQRYRGQRLGDVNGTFVEGEATVLDPVEAAIRTARQLSTRVSTRDFVESMKQRWLNTYGDLTNRKFPEVTSDIQSLELKDKERVLDAKNLQQYVKYFQQVNTSALDEGWQSLMMNMAETIEGAGESFVANIFAKVPRALEDTSPTRFMRTIPFVTYIAMNPLRQLVVQSHQLTQLTALNARYMGTQFPKEISAVFMATSMKDTAKAAKLSGISEQEISSMVKAWSDSGLPYSIDSNVLIEGAQLQAVEHLSRTRVGRAAQTATSLPKQVFNLHKKVGFDAGEYTNLLGAWLFSRNRAKELGLDVSNPEVLESIASQAREISYGMNRAGAFAYNDGLLGIATQFMSVPHKAMLTMVPGGNKALSQAERSKLAAFNLVMYGTPARLTAGITAALYEQTGEENIDPELARKIDAGLEDFLLNSIFTELGGRETNIDFENSLAPGGATFAYELISRLMEDPFTFFPAGQILFSDNSRLNIMMEDVNQIMSSHSAGSEKLVKTAEAASKLFSGYSNAYKARWALLYQRELSAQGRELPGEVGTAEAIAFLLGFQRKETGQLFDTLKDIKYTKEQVTEDVERYYFSVKRAMLNSDREESKEFIDLARRFWDTFEYDPEHRPFAIQEFNRIARQDAGGDPEKSLIGQLVKASGFTSKEQWDILIEKSPLKQETKDNLKRLRDNTSVEEE